MPLGWEGGAHEIWTEVGVGEDRVGAGWPVGAVVEEKGQYDNNANTYMFYIL